MIMKNKTFEYIYFSLWCAALVSIIWNISETYIRQKNMERVVSIEYTYTCPICNSDVAEGYYSLIDKYGYEECKNCGKYTITGDDSDEM